MNAGFKRPKNQRLVGDMPTTISILLFRLDEVGWTAIAAKTSSHDPFYQESKILSINNNNLYYQLLAIDRRSWRSSWTESEYNHRFRKWEKLHQPPGLSDQRWQRILIANIYISNSLKRWSWVSKNSLEFTTIKIWLKISTWYFQPIKYWTAISERMKHLFFGDSNF